MFYLVKNSNKTEILLNLLSPLHSLARFGWRMRCWYKIIFLSINMKKCHTYFVVIFDVRCWGVVSLINNIISKAIMLVHVLLFNELFSQHRLLKLWNTFQVILYSNYSNTRAGVSSPCMIHYPFLIFGIFEHNSSYKDNTYQQSWWN